MKLILNLKVNGVDFHKSSVLSIYLMFLDNDNNTIKTINRHYYPKEKYNHPNIDRMITSENRKLSLKEYPLHFDEDDEIRTMIIDNDVELIIGHNIMFDISFISKSFKNFAEMEKKNYFCTMVYNTQLLEIPLEYDFNKTNFFKFPSFKKTLIKYNIIKFDTDEYSSKFYVESIKDIYIKTIKNMKEHNFKNLNELELIACYKVNLINFVLCDEKFREINNNVNNGDIIEYNRLNRKFKRIVNDYNINPSIVINKTKSYSFNKLNELNAVINLHSLEFTTKYPKFIL